MEKLVFKEGDTVVNTFTDEIVKIKYIDDKPGYFYDEVLVDSHTDREDTCNLDLVDRGYLKHLEVETGDKVRFYSTLSNEYRTGKVEYKTKNKDSKVKDKKVVVNVDGEYKMVNEDNLEVLEKRGYGEC